MSLFPLICQATAPVPSPLALGAEDSSALSWIRSNVDMSAPLDVTVAKVVNTKLKVSARNNSPPVAHLPQEEVGKHISALSGSDELHKRLTALEAQMKSSASSSEKVQLLSEYELGI